MQLADKYRPATLADVVGQARTLARIETLRPRGYGGRAYWLSGESGTGKTTLARLLAAEVAGPFGTLEVDSAVCTGQWLRDLARDWGTPCLGFGDGARAGRAVIINEAHGLRRDAIRQLLVMLEAIPAHALVCFTTTSVSQQLMLDEKLDASPLISRCINLPLAGTACRVPQVRRVMAIAEAEGLAGAPESRYMEMAARLNYNMRAMLQAVETGEFKE